MKYSPLELFIKARKNTLPEQIWVCVAAALTATFYFYEYQYEQHFPVREPFLLCMAAVIFVVWIICSLFSGRDGRFGFAIFTFAYWGLPFVYTLFYAGRDNVRGYDKWLSLLNKIATALLCNPFSEASGKMNMAPQAMAAALVFISLIAYMGGFFLKRWYTAKHDKSGEGYEGEYIADEDTEADVTSAQAVPASDKADETHGLSFGGGSSEPPDLKSILGIEDKRSDDTDTPAGE